MNKWFPAILAFSILTLIAFVFLFEPPVVEPKTDKQSIACNIGDLSGRIDYSDTLAVFEGEQLRVPNLALTTNEQRVLGATNEHRWIEVDLSEQKLKAWDGGSLYLETPVSTGLPWWPTPTGEFRIWIKLRATKMEGGEGDYYYYLPNVPYVMYFENNEVPNWRGFGLHGTYWHDDFGTQRSHGCVNLPTPVAERLYYWVSPQLSGGNTSVTASSVNQGTRIVIHE